MKLEKIYLVDALLKAKIKLGIKENYLTFHELEEYEKVVKLYLKKEEIIVEENNTFFTSCTFHDFGFITLNVNVDRRNLSTKINDTLESLEPAYYTLLKCKKEEAEKMKQTIEAMNIHYQESFKNVNNLNR